MAGRAKKLRARLQQQHRDRMTYISFSAHVPCDHGHGSRCHLHVMIDRQPRRDADGKPFDQELRVVKHLSTSCKQHPPRPEEIAVLRSLRGEAFASCFHSERVASKALAGGFSHWRDREQLRDSLPPHVGALVIEASDDARKIRTERQDEAPASNPRAQLLNDWLRRKVRVPECWQLTALPLHPRKRGFEVEIKVARSPGTGGTWGYRFIVATYLGRGRFRPHHDLAQLARYVDPHASTDNGKTACVVCGKRVRSLPAHVRTQTHQDKVSAAVYDILDNISAALLQKGQQR